MPKKQVNKGSEIEFVFELDSDYRLVPCNGIWGGLTSRGDFRIDFFVESQAIPERVTNAINEETQTLGKETRRNPPKQIIRQMQVGVLMSADTAASLIGFLQERIEERQKIFEKLEHKELSVDDEHQKISKGYETPNTSLELSQNPISTKRRVTFLEQEDDAHN
jgi:hypothetical protein